MEEIITSYLDKQYRFSLSTLSSYKLYDRTNNIDVSVISIWDEMGTIFGITKEEFEPIWDKWADGKIIEINNRITEIRYKLYELNGSDIDISAADINILLRSELG
jgi:hypothetical protein